ncbi:hypothetical protein M885DRAFT_506348 [Pelagophyceae sp. CCMP2097]|nr:hypothetical protein M885DRAFT_506348 [Pelagophyceae sp. CCMP2097]|mmetsp:Transcript_30052/g.103423  ORF Transcript_30052/g.103423 Transcript_30052/m.103423 type:complete len:245 (+) Transcript_30052:93-827(+)
MLRVCVLLTASTAVALLAPHGGSSSPQRRAASARRAPRRVALRSAAFDSEAWLSTRPIAALLAGESAGSGRVARPLGVPPLEAQTAPDRAQMAKVVDWLGDRMQNLSPDADDDDEDLELYDEFIEEGRKMLAVSATRLVAGATADEVSEDVWTEVADLLTKGEAESGILVGLPGFAGSAAAFVDSELLAPLRWMGFQVEAEAFTAADGAPFPVVRLLLCPAASAAPSEDDEEWRERMNKLIDDI